MKVKGKHNFESTPQVNGTNVSIEGHTHVSNDVTDLSASIDTRISGTNFDVLADVGVSSAVSGNLLAFDGASWVSDGTNTGDEVQATETVLGIAEIATQVEVNSGTDDLKIVTPLKLEEKTHGRLKFDTNMTAPAHSEGLFYYDKNEHCFVQFNDEPDTTQQIGREFYRRVRNETGATILNGVAVYQTGSETGGEGRALIDLADASDSVKENVIGVVTHDIENNTYGYVTVLGDVNDVDTSAFNAGSILYLSPTTPGGLTETRPTADQFVVEVATAEIINATTGRLNVNITNFGRLNDFQQMQDLSSYWLTGLDVTEHDPKNQTVDYTNGQYRYQGVLKNIVSGSTYDLQNGHASQDHYSDLVDYQHRLVVLYVDGDEIIKSIGGPAAGKYEIADLPLLSIGDVCVAIIDARVDSGGNPKDIEDKNIRDCRTSGFFQQDELVSVSPDSTQAGYLADVLVNSGNVTFTIQSPGGPETLRADIATATTSSAGVVELATDGETAANVVVQGNDSRLSDARTPVAHTHVSSEVTDLNSTIDSRITGSDHGLLSGLSDDDHPQYQLRSEENQPGGYVGMTGSFAYVTGAMLFNTGASSPTHQEGLVFWDSGDHTLAQYLDEVDITQQLGQEGYVRVYNGSGGTISNGQVVYISGTEGVEYRPSIGLADASTKSTSQVVGFATHDIENGTFGYVTSWGLVNDLDTSAFTEGDTLYLDETTSGSIRSTPPPEGNYEVQVGYVIRSHATLGRILAQVNPDLGAQAGDASEIVAEVIKNTGGTINPGQVVYVDNYNLGQDLIEVELANASSGSTMPAFGVARDTITASQSGQVVLFGKLKNQNTAAWSIGDPLYVDTASGGLTNIKPTGTALVQKVAIVARSHASSGVIEVFGAGRSNDLPNIASGSVWMGDGSGVPQATSRSGLDDTAIHDNVASEISAITEKTNPANADLIIIEDSESSNVKKKVQIGNLPGGGIYGANYQHSQSLGEQTTTSATYVDFLTLTSAGSLNGTYRIDFSFRGYNSDKQGEFRLFNSTDSTTLWGDALFRVKTDGFQVAGSAEVAMSGSAKTFKLQFRDTAGINNQYVYDSHLFFYRVS